MLRSRCNPDQGWQRGVTHGHPRRGRSEVAAPRNPYSCWSAAFLRRLSWQERKVWEY